MITPRTNIIVDKYFIEFIKNINWGGYKYIFDKALKSLSYDHNDSFSFEKMNFDKCKKNPSEFINSFDSKFQNEIYVKTITLYITVYLPDN